MERRSDPSVPEAEAKPVEGTKVLLLMVPTSVGLSKNNVVAISGASLEAMFPTCEESAEANGITVFWNKLLTVAFQSEVWMRAPDLFACSLTEASCI